MKCKMCQYFGRELTQTGCAHPKSWICPIDDKHLHGDDGRPTHIILAEIEEAETKKLNGINKDTEKCPLCGSFNIIQFPISDRMWCAKCNSYTEYTS